MTRLITDILKTVDAEDPVETVAWLHSDGETWHIDLTPTLIQEEDGPYARTFSVHLSCLAHLFDPVDVTADLTCISIAGTFEERLIHVVIHLGQDDEDDHPEVQTEKAYLPN